MGMIRSDAKVPTPEQVAALKEAAKRGSLSHEKEFREGIEAWQQRLPAARPAPTVAISPAETQFQQALATIIQVAGETSDPQIECLAKATQSALSLLAVRK